MAKERNYLSDFNKNPVLSGKDASKLGSFIPYGISTQSLKLDLAIGCPGIPGARMSQFYGLDGCGKSTLMQHLIAECQAMGGEAVLIDTEDAYDFKRARKIGIDVERLHILEPDSLEELLDMLVDFTKAFFDDPANKPGVTPLLFIVDSMEGLGSEAQLDAEASDQHFGMEARVIGRNISRVLRKTCRNYKATIAIISQQYDKMGGNQRFGPEYVVKGGKAVRYRASLRIEIKAGQGTSNKLVDASDKQIGYRNVIKTWKNKSAAPFKEADYMLTFDNGIDRVQDLFEAGLELGIIQGGAAGRYKGKLGKTEFEFHGKKDWPICLKKLGGVEKVFRLMTRYAIKNGYLKAYAYENEEKPGE